MSQNNPVITIDGPSGSGKGTIAYSLAEKLGWPLLDSGAIYRVLGLAAQKNSVTNEQVEQLVELATDLPLEFIADKESGEVLTYLAGEDVSGQIRTDEAGQMASRVAVIPEVREALLERQRAFSTKVGLVADGRDMGTLVFPQAQVKIFLTASAETRAKRRYNQLKEKGINASLSALLESIHTRDERDKTRSVAPLVPAEGAFVVDSSLMSKCEVFAQVYDIVAKKMRLDT